LMIEGWKLRIGCWAQLEIGNWFWWGFACQKNGIKGVYMVIWTNQLNSFIKHNILNNFACQKMGSKGFTWSFGQINWIPSLNTSSLTIFRILVGMWYKLLNVCHITCHAKDAKAIWVMPWLDVVDEYNDTWSMPCCVHIWEEHLCRLEHNVPTKV
jgi:hypothetical protein